MAQWFLVIDILAVKKLEGYQLWYLFEKIYFQGRDKLIFQSISPNEFREVPHTIGCKSLLGTVC